MDYGLRTAVGTIINLGEEEMGLDLGLEDLVPEAATLVLTVQPGESCPTLPMPLFSLLRNGESGLCFSGILDGMALITIISIFSINTAIHLDFSDVTH